MPSNSLVDNNSRLRRLSYMSNLLSAGSLCCQENKIQYTVGMLRSMRMAALLIFLSTNLLAQAAPSQKSTVRPESGFVSHEKYANAFFGFSLSLPQDPYIRDLSIPTQDRSRHSLFGLQAQTNGLTALTVVATETSGHASEEDAKKAVTTPGADSPVKMQIGGKEFWKSESHEDKAGTKMQSLAYATGVNGYVVKFTVVSFDPHLADELQRSIESITFFDPAKAKSMAGPNSHPYVVTQKGFVNQF